MKLGSPHLVWACDQLVKAGVALHEMHIEQLKIIVNNVWELQCPRAGIVLYQLEKSKARFDQVTITTFLGGNTSQFWQHDAIDNEMKLFIAKVKLMKAIWDGHDGHYHDEEAELMQYGSSDIPTHITDVLQMLPPQVLENNSQHIVQRLKTPMAKVAAGLYLSKILNVPGEIVDWVKMGDTSALSPEDKDNFYFKWIQMYINVQEDQSYSEKSKFQQKAMEVRRKLIDELKMKFHQQLQEKVNEELKEVSHFGKVLIYSWICERASPVECDGASTYEQRACQAAVALNNEKAALAYLSLAQHISNTERSSKYLQIAQEKIDGIHDNASRLHMQLQFFNVAISY